MCRAILLQQPAPDHGIKKESKGKILRKHYKKLKDEVFTPVMERARRVSRSISRPFGEEWSSDEEEGEEPPRQRSRRRRRSTSTDSDDPDTRHGSNIEAIIIRQHSRNNEQDTRPRRKSAAGFLMSYATHKFKHFSTVDSVDVLSQWVFSEDSEAWHHPTGEAFFPGDVHLSELHPRELDYLRSKSLDRYNEKNTGATAVLPKDPGRKAKRSNSIQRKSEKEKHKLLAGGIFGMPLHVVLLIDDINGNKADSIIRCIRDKKRRSKEGGGSPSNSTPRLVKRFNSLKARSISPINFSPGTRIRSATMEDGFDSLKVPSDSHLMSRSLSTPATPLDSRKLRPSNSASAIYNQETPIMSLNDLVSKLTSAQQGSVLSLTTKEGASTLEVPRILQNCCDFVLAHGLDQQGIFRVCGAKKQIRTLRAEFNTTSNVVPARDTSVHVVAGLVKEFLKELPEALLSKTLYYPFLHCKRLESLDVRLEAYKELIRLLPRPNRDTLQFLLQFCNVVVDHSSDSLDNDGLPIDGNLMDAANLAIVFGPNILHRRRTGHDSKAQLSTEAWEAPQVIEVVQELIEHHQSLFTVESEIRKQVLHMMHEIKQSHFDSVLNEYSGVDEDSRYTNSPDLSSDNKLRSDSYREGFKIRNGSSGFVSGAGSATTSAESLPYKPCSSSRADCIRGYCERQHSSPELGAMELDPELARKNRLSRSLDQGDDVFPDSVASKIPSKESLYDLTPPSSPLFDRASAHRAGIFCKTKLAKSPSARAGGYGALSPNQTYTQFRLDRIPAGTPPAQSPAQSAGRTGRVIDSLPTPTQHGAQSPRLPESRRAAMKRASNVNNPTNARPVNYPKGKPARKSYAAARESDV